MVDPTTTNRSLAVPTHGSDVDTWDVPVNANMAKLDTIVGGVLTLSTTGGSVALNAAQLACCTIIVTGALASSYTIVYPDLQGWWTLANFTSNSASFVVAVTSGAQTSVICIPPGEFVEVQIWNSAQRYRNLGRIGSYLDMPLSTVPLWITSGSVPPYLFCGGGTFSAVTYPYLASLLNGTTLPDFRGRAPFFLNGGTGRLTTAGAGIDGDTLLAPGGTNGVTLAANQIPTITSVNANQNISVISGSLIAAGGTPNTVGTPGTGSPTSFLSSQDAPATRGSSGINNISATYTNASQQVVGNAAPGIVAGIRLIRAG